MIYEKETGDIKVTYNRIPGRVHPDDHLKELTCSGTGDLAYGDIGPYPLIRPPAAALDLLPQSSERRLGFALGLPVHPFV